MRKVIKDITCSVNHCIYNEDGCRCAAGCIEVGPSSASKCSDTLCSTFRPESDSQSR